jgi:hypothetical protein
VNVTNIYNIHNGPGRGFGGVAPLRAGGAYSNLRLAAMNERVRGGISTVPTGQFGTGRATPAGVNAETFRGGRMIAGNLPVVPTRAALSVSDRPAAASTVPRGGQRQTYFSRSRPAAAPPSFDRQVTQMRQSIQGNAAGTGANQNSAMTRPTPGVRTPVGGGFGNASGAAASGVPMSGAPTAERGANLNNNLSNNDRMGRPTASDGSGWRRFSDSSPAQHDGAMNRQTGVSPAATPNNNVPRPGNSGRPEASTNDGSWRHFTPQSGGGAADRGNNRGMSSGRSTGPDFQRSEMSHPDREIGGGRGVAQESPRSYSRPPLEMRQPIVTPRGSEVRGSAPQPAPSRGGGGGGGGGNRGGSGGGPHGSSSRH